MPAYRCYFLDSDDRIRGSQEIQCHTDAEAVHVARRMLARRPHEHAFELWQGTRRVQGEPREPLRGSG